MFTLTQQEVELLEKSTDPAIVAITQKLKKVESEGEFIPKSRLQRETEKVDNLSKELARFKLEQEEKQKLQAQKELEATKEKATWQAQLEAEQVKTKTESDAHLQTKAKLDAEAKLADAFRSHQKNVVEAVKKQMGDKWVDEYANLSLEALAKLSGVPIALLGVVNGKPAIPESDTYTQEQLDRMSPEEMAKPENIAKVNKSAIALSIKQEK